jgi:hypothetical protein
MEPIYPRKVKDRWLAFDRSGQVHRHDPIKRAMEENP